MPASRAGCPGAKSSIEGGVRFVRTGNIGARSAYTLPPPPCLLFTIGATARYVSTDGAYRKRCSFGAQLTYDDNLTFVISLCLAKTQAVTLSPWFTLHDGCLAHR